MKKMLLFEIIEKTIYYAEKMLDTATANIFLIVPLMIFCNFFISVQWYFYILFGIIVIDIITAIAAALKNKEKIESNKFFNSIIKLTYYFVIMFFVYLIDYFIIKNSYMLINLVSIIILINELISIDENVCKLINRKTALTKLFKIVEKLYYDFINNLFKKNE